MTRLATLAMLISIRNSKKLKNIPFLLSVLITKNYFSEDVNNLQKLTVSYSQSTYNCYNFCKTKKFV